MPTPIGFFADGWVNPDPIIPNPLGTIATAGFFIDGWQQPRVAAFPPGIGWFKDGYSPYVVWGETVFTLVFPWFHPSIDSPYAAQICPGMVPYQEGIE